MELCSRNFLETATQLVVNSNTFTAEYLMSREERFQYVSDGYDNDSLTSSITVRFDQTTTIDRIALLGINVKKMNIYYGGVTANSFTLTGPTTTSQFTQNSAGSLWLPCTPVAVTSVTFDCYSTQTPNVEKALGFMLLSAHQFTLPRIPSAGDYTPTIKNKELRHELSTGGVRSHSIDQKWNLKFKYKYLDEDDRDSLKEIYDTHEAMFFAPWATTTGWDGVVFEANWTGPFDFYKFSDNAVASGYTGSILLEET